MQATEDQKQFELVTIKKNIGAEFTHVYFNVLVDHRDPPQPWTL